MYLWVPYLTIMFSTGKTLMRDAVTTLIKNYDLTGRYLDRDAITSLKSYFESGSDRITVAALINANSPEIVKEAGIQLFEEVPELIRPGGNALVAGDPDVLDERVLQGLRETYNSLGVPIAPTVRGIQIMKEKIKAMAADAGVADTSFVDEPFDHMSREFSEISV